MNDLPDSLTHLIVYGETSIPKYPPSLSFFHMPKDNCNRSVLPSFPLPKNISSFMMIPNWFNNLHTDFGSYGSLKTLNLGDLGGSKINSLIIPDSLQNLSFSGNIFKRLDNNYLPSNLSFLYCGQKCLLSISEFPSSLRSLTFPLHSKFPILSLPPNLTYLSLPEDNTIVNCSLPLSLKNLTIFGYHPDISLLSSLTSLIITLKEETFVNQGFPLLPLPSSLSHLHLTANEQPFDLPPSLSHLSLNGNIHLSSLPLSLTHLNLLPKFNQRLPSLPLSLTHLTLQNYFTNPLPPLPPNLILLSLHTYKTYFHKLPALPSTIKYLIIPFISNPLPNIPTSLMWLCCHRDWYSAFPPPSLPPWCHVHHQFFYVE